MFCFIKTEKSETMRNELPKALFLIWTRITDDKELKAILILLFLQSAEANTFCKNKTSKPC